MNLLLKFILIASFSSNLLSQSEEIRIMDITIEGNQRLTAQDVQRNARLYKGMSIKGPEIQQAIKRRWNLNRFGNIQILIEDETDEGSGTLIKEIAKDEYLVSALTTIEIFNEKFGSNLSHKDFDTGGGIVMHHFARYPKPNDAINIDNLRFVINSIERRRIKRIKVSKIT